jgi:hypothetical protein
VKRVPVALALGLWLAASVALAAAPVARNSASRLARPTRSHSLDLSRRIDVNNINMFTTNFGATAWDLASGGPGLVYPKGTAKTAVFAAGLWIGATINGGPNVTAAEYSQEYGPGAAYPGGTFDDPSDPRLVTYKVARYTGNPLDSAHVERTPEELAADPLLDPLLHHSWSEYMAGAVPSGAPSRLYRLPRTDTPAPDDSVNVPGPNVSGDQMLWCVYNDLDPARHTNNAGSSLPLGVEIQQTIYAFDRPGALGNTVFLRYRILNKGTHNLQDMYVSQWSDIDVGGPTDDLAGCDPDRGMGYVYNASASDPVYGAASPASGYLLLKGPLVAGTPRPLTAFNRYINGTDPTFSSESYNYMKGLLPDGSTVIDPVTGLPTPFMVPGDPTTGTGWIDTNPADRRILLSSGPCSMAPGQEQDVTFAVVIGAASHPLASLATLQCAADDVRFEFQHGFDPALTPPACTMPVLNCPGTAEYWMKEYLAGGSAAHSYAQLGAIAAQVDVESDLFDWSAGVPFDSLRAKLLDESDVRAAAGRRYGALLANVSVRRLGLPFSNGGSKFLNPSSPIACSGFSASSIEDLLVPPVVNSSLTSATYDNLVADHRRALSGFNVGLEQFSGGAGYGSSFFGSSLDPVSQPDSFGTVEIRFSHTTTQKAYRYLRLEQPDGSLPLGGREYRYGGFHDVNFTAWDVTHNEQLDVAWVERAVTDFYGTLLGPESQVATFDSTWAPSDDMTGGREYLFITRRPYGAGPKPEFMADGYPAGGTMPVLYALWAYLRSPSDVIDDGDRFTFSWGIPIGSGLDQMFLLLAPRPLGEPGVTDQYNAITSCLESINAGLGIGPTCAPEPVADVPPDPVFQGSGLQLAPVRPNPVRSAMSIAFMLPVRGPVRLDLLDVAGRRVMTRELGTMDPGPHTIELALDSRARAGIYFVRLGHGGRATMRKAIVVR